MKKIILTFLFLFSFTGQIFAQSLESRILEYHKGILEKRFPPDEVQLNKNVINSDIDQDGVSDLIIDYSLLTQTNFGATRTLGNGVTVFTIKADTLNNVFDYLVDGGASTLAVYKGNIYRGNEQYTSPYDFESFYKLTLNKNKEQTTQSNFIKDTLTSVLTIKDFELLKKFPNKFENYLVLPDESIEWDYNIREVLNDYKNYRFPIIGIDLGDFSQNSYKIYPTISEEMAFEIISDKELYKSDENALRNLNRANVFGKIVRNNYNGTDLPRYYFEIYQIITLDEYGDMIKKYERK
ncbi:hypothetical protein [Mariniflexile sp.]|uniref:hypothetical protein n=1 Tax=Mariniflexile sp. TaxID=1979402 RepID=UPI0040488252